MPDQPLGGDIVRAMDESAFATNKAGLSQAIDALTFAMANAEAAPLPDLLPETGIGPIETLTALEPLALRDGRHLGAPGFFAHMDPPTPWITWATALWSASMNQNLLHPDTAPIARQIEERAVQWLVPFFGQSGGHFTPGSTVSNLTAIWAAREAGAREVVSSRHAHVSIAKSAHLLGLPHRQIDDWTQPGDTSASCVVVTAGNTSSGAIEPLDPASDARWRHVDAAWAGPLRFSETHRSLLDGIETADSVAVSAHKWLFQPKESALVLFRDHEAAHASISVGADYLTVPNVGVLGSHGASALGVVATLMAYGRSGIGAMIDHTMELAEQLHRLVVASDDFDALSPPQAGVLCWQHKEVPVSELRANLTEDVFVSSTTIDGEAWLRSVAANPMADPEMVFDAVRGAAAQSG